jgi:hypothetical protein
VQNGSTPGPTSLLRFEVILITRRTEVPKTLPLSVYSKPTESRIQDRTFSMATVIPFGENAADIRQTDADPAFVLMVDARRERRQLPVVPSGIGPYRSTRFSYRPRSSDEGNQLFERVPGERARDEV